MAYEYKKYMEEPIASINITDTSVVDVLDYATAQVSDENLVASNIKEGTAILGVQGTFSGDPTGDATLTSGDEMLSGVTAYSQGTKYTGTIPTKVAADVTVTGQAYQEAEDDYAWKTNITIPAGYFADDTSIEKTYSDVFPAPASEGNASQLLVGAQLFDHTGKKLTGTMPNNSAVSATISTQGGTYTVPAGYHDGEGTVTASLPAGTATTPATTKQQSQPTFSRSGNVVTATVAATSVSVTPTVSPGYITAGTAGTVTMSANSNTYTIPTQTKTATANGTVSPDSGYLLSAVTVAIPVYDGSIS